MCLYAKFFTSILVLIYSANQGDSADSDFTPQKKWLGKRWFQQTEMGCCPAAQGPNGQTQAIQFNGSGTTRHKLMNRDFFPMMNGRRRRRRG